MAIKEIYLSNIGLDELLLSLRSMIQEELLSYQAKKQGEKLLSPKEACQLFHPAISKVTLYNWTKQGKLQTYRIGRKVLYKQSEVLQALQTIKKYKRTS